jgi:hypothetical protein
VTATNAARKIPARKVNFTIASFQHLASMVLRIVSFSKTDRRLLNPADFRRCGGISTGWIAGCPQLIADAGESPCKGSKDFAVGD